MPERDLNTLLAGMKPELDDATYVFCSVTKEKLLDITFQLRSIPLCQFKEAEGVTLILQEWEAKAVDVPYENTWSRIICTVASDLTAVGFLAAMSAALAEADISLNAVSAFHHDHLFVLSERAREAMAILRKLSEKAEG